MTDKTLTAGELASRLEDDLLARGCAVSRPSRERIKAAAEMLRKLSALEGTEIEKELLAWAQDRRDPEAEAMRAAADELRRLRGEIKASDAKVADAVARADSLSRRLRAIAEVVAEAPRNIHTSTLLNRISRASRKDPQP